MNALQLAELPPGFPDPVHDAQRVFRRLLDAMSRPGRLQTIDGPVAPSTPGLGAAAAAVLLAVADAEVAVWLHPTCGPRVADWLRFHTGARVVATPREADWLVMPAAAAAPGVWADANPGTDEAPHTAATLLIDAPGLGSSPQLHLAGPGIAHAHPLSVDGLDRAFWMRRIAQQPDFPRGADLVLTHGNRLAAVPRSTRITLED